MFSVRSIVLLTRQNQIFTGSNLTKILLGARELHFLPAKQAELFDRKTNATSFFQLDKKLFHAQTRVLFQVEKQQKSEKILSSLVESNQESSQVSTHVTGARKVKQAAKDVSYGLIILAGGLMLFAIGYYLFTELFSRETPSGIYNESSKMCLKNYEVEEALGHPIKVTAESGGRRVFQIRHKFYFEDGRLCLSINYYLEGPKNKGTVFCKVKKNETSGKFEYEHIIVKLDFSHMGNRQIVVKSRDTEQK